MFPRIQAKPSVKNCLRHSNADKTEQCWLKNKNCLNPDCKIESFQHTYAHTYEITRYWIHSEFGRNSRIAGILSWNRGTFKKGTECCYGNNQRVNKINAWFPGANQSMTARSLHVMLNQTEQKNNQIPQQQLKAPHSESHPEHRSSAVPLLQHRWLMHKSTHPSLARLSTTRLSPFSGCSPSLVAVPFICLLGFKAANEVWSNGSRLYRLLAICLISSPCTTKGLVRQSQKPPCRHAGSHENSTGA